VFPQIPVLRIKEHHHLAALQHGKIGPRLWGQAAAGIESRGVSEGLVQFVLLSDPKSLQMLPEEPREQGLKKGIHIKEKPIEGQRSCAAAEA
jgi:hypothetical protein